MDTGFTGLGKMGLSMALNVHEQGWSIIGFDVTKEARATAREQGLSVVDSLSELLKALSKRKVVFSSTPIGQITNQLMAELVEQLVLEGIIVGSGNSNFHDSVANTQLAKRKGIYFIDCGTFGGIRGARERACLMVGGAPGAVKVLVPLFEGLACGQGYLYAGESGAGHYLRMVHNGIEYVMMQVMGEGFNLLEAAEYDFALEKVADVWNHGSIIKARLMSLAKEVFAENPTLTNLEGKVVANGEAKWMIEEALRLGMLVSTTVLSSSTRNESMLANHFSSKVVASLRQGSDRYEVARSQ